MTDPVSPYGFNSGLLGEPQPVEAYLMLVANIDQVVVQRLAQQLANAVAAGITRLHLLIHSGGGGLGDGVAACMMLRSSPLEIWTYSYSNVLSAAAIVYLGGHKRFVAQSSVFMLHRGIANLQGAHASLVRTRAASTALEDQQLDDIYKTHLRLSPEQWSAYESCELWLGAQESIDVGMADEIRIFTPKKDAPLVNVYSF